jgi:Tol biopolymer transport system component
VESFSWSPDSRQIAFSTASALKKISIMGEPPQTIFNGWVRGRVAWNRGGVILFEPGENQPLHKLSATGGESRPVTRLDPSRQETSHSLPQFLPDGRHFMYLTSSNKPENIAMYLGSLDSPQVKRVQDGHAIYAPPGYLIFARGQSLMAQRFDVRTAELSGDSMLLVDSVANGPFTVSENGVLTYRPGSGMSLPTQLVWFDRSGKRLGTVGEPAVYTNPAISPDQKRVAVGKLDPKTNTRDIWVIDLQRNTSSRFTFDPADDLNPTWSPDGTRIAFSSSRKGSRDIYVKAAGGVEEEQALVESKDGKSLDDWSGDGQYLIWDIGPHEGLFSFKEHKSSAFVGSRFVQGQFRFSPNRSGPPRWIAYPSRETGAKG